MDASHRAAPFTLTSLLVLLFCSLIAFSQTAGGHDAGLAEAKRLADNKQWGSLLLRFPVAPDTPPAIQLYQGIALGHLGRLTEAERVLRAGAAKAPTIRGFRSS